MPRSKSGTGQRSQTSSTPTSHLSPKAIATVANALKVPPDIIAEAIEIAVGNGPKNGWWHCGACWAGDASLFFPERGQSAAPGKAVCSACSMRATCLAAALLTNERFGIWGGLTERQRRLLRKTLANAGVLKVIKQERDDILTNLLLELDQEAKDHERYMRYAKPKHHPGVMKTKGRIDRKTA